MKASTFEFSISRIGIPIVVILAVLGLGQAWGLWLVRTVSGPVIFKERVEPSFLNPPSYFLVVDDGEGSHSIKVNLSTWASTKVGDHVTLEAPK